MLKLIDQHRLSASVGIHEFFLDEELLLFSEQDYNLYRLNTSAAFIWCHYLEGFSIQRTIQALVNDFEISAEKARCDVLTSLTKWRQLGLLDAPNALLRTPPRLARTLTTIASDQARASSITFAQEHCYRLANLCFQIRFATPAIAQAVHPLFAHLAVDSTIPANTGFDIITHSEGYLLLRNAALVARCKHLRELGPIVHGEVLATTCKSTDSLAVIHAAAITNGTHTILFPGDSGSGKSTLAAALITAGYGYLSDEIALLSHRPYRVLPVPLSISLKEGAWSALSSLHPMIEKLPIYHRQDGKKVRYLPPPSIPTQTATDYPVTRIIFPRYMANTAPQVRTISRAEALCRITEGGYTVNGYLSAATVSDLVTWISGIECYEMYYSSSSQALSYTQKLT